MDVPRFVSEAHVSRTMPGPLLLLGLGGLCLLGCEQASRPSVTTADSAGIPITINPVTASTFAVVDPEPVLTLGGPGAEGPTQFFQIQGLHVDPRGRIWVADGQSSEVRVFLPDGAYYKTVGGRGEGPGEFQRLRLLGPFQGDSVAVWDLGLGRVTVLDPDGNLARTELMDSDDGVSIRCSDVFPDGSLLGQVPTILPASSLEPGRILGDSARLVRVDPSLSMKRTWATSDGPRWIWTGRSQVPLPFTANPGFDLLGEELHLVSGPSFRVRVFEEGKVVRIYGVDQDARQVGGDELADYRAFVEEFIPESAKDDYLGALDSPGLPQELPGYSDVLVSSSGDVWVQVYSTDLHSSGAWHVFDGGGVWQGEVETPPDFWLRDILDDRIAGVWRDPVGVEYVRMYGLWKGDPGDEIPIG